MYRSVDCVGWAKTEPSKGPRRERPVGMGHWAQALPADPATEAPGGLMRYRSRGHGARPVPAGPQVRDAGDHWGVPVPSCSRVTRPRGWTPGPPRSRPAWNCLGERRQVHCHPLREPALGFPPACRLDLLAFLPVSPDLRDSLLSLV